MRRWLSFSGLGIRQSPFRIRLKERKSSSMAMAVGTGKGPKCDINITPYIDILLVLLIIFMVITPTKQLDLEVKVPQENTNDKNTPPPAGVIVVSMSETAQLAINQEPISFGELGPKLLEIYSARANKNMFISASAKLPYGDVVKIIDIAKGAGVQDVGLLTAEEIR
jgi:biopolymer transport protein ExbD